MLYESELLITEKLLTYQIKKGKLQALLIMQEISVCGLIKALLHIPGIPLTISALVAFSG